MQTLNEYLQTYGQYHQVSTNRLTHYFGVPMIILSLLLALHWIRIDIASVWVVPCNWLLLAGVLVFYYRLNVRLALLITVIIIPLTWFTDWVAGETPTILTGILVLFLFVVGWVLQFVGHWFEKQKPAFMTSLTQLFIGPLFFVVEGLTQLKLQRYFGLQ